ncbi:MAG: LicD family protein [bacterium]|nr:LicD family protein [bacterium]
MNKYLEQQFALQVQAAREAEIYPYFFLAYGSLLGYVREKGMITDDSDMDVGILADKVDKGQIDHFIRALRDKGLYTARETHQVNPASGKHWWTSIKNHGEGMKCCNWFQFEFKGWLWHHKGPGARIKGAPAEYFKIGPEIEFLGTKIHIPKFSGALCDFWYPDWLTKRSGSSFGIDMKVKNWKDKSTWKIIN